MHSENKDIKFLQEVIILSHNWSVKIKQNRVGNVFCSYAGCACTALPTPVTDWNADSCWYFQYPSIVFFYLHVLQKASCRQCLWSESTWCPHKGISSPLNQSAYKKKKKKKWKATPGTDFIKKRRGEKRWERIKPPTCNSVPEGSQWGSRANGSFMLDTFQNKTSRVTVESGQQDDISGAKIKHSDKRGD